MNMSQMHVDCISKVYSFDYFVSLFEQCRNVMGYDEENLANLTDPELICSFWNNFWFALPDSLAIQRQPFNSICDICEYEYRDD